MGTGWTVENMRPSGLLNEEVATFLEPNTDPQQVQDILLLISLLDEVVGEPATMWGPPSQIGFGIYRYRDTEGVLRERPIIAVISHEKSITLEFVGGWEMYEADLQQLGRYRLGKSSLNIKKYADIDEDVLVRMVTTACHFVEDEELRLEAEARQ